MKLSSQPKPKVKPLQIPYTNFWSKVPHPQLLKNSYTNSLTDLSSSETPVTQKTHSTALKIHISQASPFHTDLDLQSSRETPYKETILSSRKSPELETLLSNINSNKAINKSTVKVTPLKLNPDSGKLDNYLGYLSSRSTERDLTTFREKMTAKVQQKQDKNPYRNWLEGVLPTEVRNVTSFNDISSRVNSLNLLEKSELEPYGNYTPVISSARSIETRSTRLTIGRKISSEKTIIENRIESSIAEKLAEEVAKNYKICRENIEANGSLKSKVVEMLKQEGVLHVFKGKVPQQYRLSVRVFMDMVEIREQDEKGRVMSVERLMITEQEDPIAALRKNGKVVRSKYSLYKRVNEKLVTMNMDHQIQKIQVLENDLLQAHESFRNRKAVTLERISKVDPEKFRKIKLQCENVEKLVPRFGEASEGMTKENASKIPKHIRKVNKRLDRAVKNLQGNLLVNVNNYRCFIGFFNIVVHV